MMMAFFFLEGRIEVAVIFSVRTSTDQIHEAPSPATSTAGIYNARLATTNILLRANVGCGEQLDQLKGDSFVGHGHSYGHGPANIYQMSNARSGSTRKKILDQRQNI